MVVLGALGAYFWFSIWSLIFFAGYGVLYGSASDARWHECGHGTAFKTRWMNTVVYNLASFMIMRDPTVWRGATPATTPTPSSSDAIRRSSRCGRRRSATSSATSSGSSTSRGPSRRCSSTPPGASPSRKRPSSPRPSGAKVYWTARVWLLIYGATVLACIVSRSILPAMFIGLPRMYGAWHHIMTGLTQHSGLAEDVTDHRLNTRTVYMNPVSRFIYLNMNYHVEHHMFPMVPYYSLPALHAEIKDDLPEPAPSIPAAFREFLPVMLRQRHDTSRVRRPPGDGRGPVRARPDAVHGELGRGLPRG